MLMPRKQMTPGQVDRKFDAGDLHGDPKRKTALLINPPVYDTQYWAEWAQPYGLLRIAALLKKHQYKKLWLFDFMETGVEREVPSHRINPDEGYGEQDRPTEKVKPITLEKDGQRL